MSSPIASKNRFLKIFPQARRTEKGNERGWVGDEGGIKRSKDSWMALVLPDTCFDTQPPFTGIREGVTCFDCQD